jgi:hypothetical protein
MGKFDLDTIVKEYTKGASLPELEVKHKISRSYLYQELKKRGLIRNISESLLPDGWRKLSPMAGGGTRILSLPCSVYSLLGYGPKDKIRGKWEILDGVLILRLKKE